MKSPAEIITEEADTECELSRRFPGTIQHVYRVFKSIINVKRLIFHMNFISKLSANWFITVIFLRHSKHLKVGSHRPFE